MFTGLLGMIPHAAILICNMYIVFFLIDRVNTAMCFIDNDMTKALLVIMCIFSMFTSLSLIRAQKKADRARARRIERQNRRRRGRKVENVVELKKRAHKKAA